jgi:DNA-binding transcriptional ArsR family regulator
VNTDTRQDLAALGDATRRAIFERLARGPLAVGEVARGLPVSRPAVSQHLRVLKEAGLVRDTARGTRRLYQLDPRGVAALRAYFDRMWDHALAAYQREVERGEGEPAPKKTKKKKAKTQTRDGER